MADCTNCGKHIMDDADAEEFPGFSPEELYMCICDTLPQFLARAERGIHLLDQGLYEAWLQAVTPAQTPTEIPESWKLPRSLRGGESQENTENSNR